MKKLVLPFMMICSYISGFSQDPKVLMDSSGLIAKNATLEKVSSQFSFTEGPAVNRRGEIYFTDQPNDKIWKYDTKGDLSLFMDKTGRSNGLYFDRSGNIIACADEKGELWSITPDGSKTILLDNLNGKQFNGPNDLWIDANGGIYFTDPYYQRNYWTRQQSALDGMKVYYLPKGSKQPLLLEDKMTRPNGIVGSADGKLLYVADIGAGKIFRYTITAPGVLADKQLFFNQGADGMTLDNKGNLYLSGNGVTIISKEGNRIGYIPVPSKWVGNLCFGGKKKDILFITASESIYTIKMRVKGVE
ncbi:SMP-30/gluconolactonase/LRE family protein [Terrimonas sp. NA20]|uniref:SMP-30/gluconolactonase/LRE family protein n=1 Tax=Terrimonas ginsenosidimutans TaxID=2908004 RepID=A0ABS9KWZ1_9BACT|nr:SMP-30/gluconolactonase/LRE family protein [Terrimonas ginsenosidimutans]MCG2616825.1 SMP-30/gluconolactonase/LRE family protein [Terrimonas ginsenosidimutans]